MKSFLAWDGVEKRLIIIPRAADMDDARDQSAGPNSDGGELSIIEVPRKGSPVDVTEELGIND